MSLVQVEEVDSVLHHVVTWVDRQRFGVADGRDENSDVVELFIRWPSEQQH